MKSLNVLLIFVAIFSSTDIALGLGKMKITQTTPGDGCVWLYDACDFSGNKKEYCSDADSMPDFNDKATSVRLGKGVSLTVFQHYYFGGESLEITSDSKCLSGQSLNKNASSLKLRPATGCVWLFADCSYSSTRKVFCSNTDMPSDFNDKASSIITGEFTSYKLFEHGGYQGKVLESNQDISCLTNNGFNDMLSSLQVYTTTPKTGCVWLYENCNFEGAIKEYCSNTDFLSDFNDRASSLKLGKNTKVQIFEDGSYGGKSVTLITDVSCLVNNNFNDLASSLKLLEVTSTSEKVEAACARFSPLIYIHGDEKYFPVKIESLGINWTGVNLSDSNAKISYTVTQNNLEWNAPLYTKIKRGNDGSYQCIYAVIFGYNDCGPTATISASTVSQVGDVGFSDQRIYLCPAGVHNGDIEHAIVTLDSNLKAQKVKLAYHKWDTEFGLNDLQWEGTHPVAYMAKGSHALYSTASEQKYFKLWDERAGTNSKCPDICYSTVSVPYPCGIGWCGWHPCVDTCYEDVTTPYPCLKDCWIGAYTNGYFLDFTSKNRKWIPPVRVIASNVYDVSGLSTDEQNLLKYQGRLGQDIVNEGWRIVQDSIKATCKPVTNVCSSCDSAINSGLSSANDELQSEAPTSLATKDWWN